MADVPRTGEEGMGVESVLRRGGIHRDGAALRRKGRTAERVFGCMLTAYFSMQEKIYSCTMKAKKDACALHLNEPNLECVSKCTDGVRLVDEDRSSSSLVIRLEFLLDICGPN